MTIEQLERLATKPPPAGLRGQVRTSYRPTTNDQRPTTNDQRPTTNDQRPTTNDIQQELLRWGKHVEAGGPVFPLALIGEESQGPSLSLASTAESASCGVQRGVLSNHSSRWFCQGHSWVRCGCFGAVQHQQRGTAMPVIGTAKSKRVGARPRPGAEAGGQGPTGGVAAGSLAGRLSSGELDR